jgi:hypothetical protein
MASEPYRPGSSTGRRWEAARFAGLTQPRELLANYFGRKVTETLPNCPAWLLGKAKADSPPC